MLLIARAAGSSVLAPALRQAGIPKISKGRFSSLDNDSDSPSDRPKLRATVGTITGIAGGIMGAALGYWVFADCFPKSLPTLQKLGGTVGGGLLTPFFGYGFYNLGYIFPKTTIVASSIVAACIINDCYITNSRKTEWEKLR